MEKIEGIELDTLINSVSTQLLEEKTKSVAGIIKSFILKAEQLAKDIQGLDKEKAKKEKSLQDTLDIINKVKFGDWSVLKEINSSNSTTEQSVV